MSTDKEIKEALDWGKDFVKERVKELKGKTPEDTLPDKVSAITFVSFRECFGDGMAGVMLQSELFFYGALIAYSILKFQEQEKETATLDKLMES